MAVVGFTLTIFVVFAEVISKEFSTSLVLVMGSAWLSGLVVHAR